MTIAELNAADVATFVSVVGPLFEHSPWIGEAAAHVRPFANRAALFDQMVAILEGAPERDQLAVIRAHPDLAGRFAHRAQLTRESSKEQAGAGLMALSDAEAERFSELNDAYRTKFGFPFILCARENTKESILAAMGERLTNLREVEIETALREIVKIVRYRFDDVIEADA